MRELPRRQRGAKRGGTAMAASLQAHRPVSQQLRRGARRPASYPDLRSGAEEEISKSLYRFLKTGFEILGSNFIAEARESKPSAQRKSGFANYPRAAKSRVKFRPIARGFRRQISRKLFAHRIWLVNLAASRSVPHTGCVVARCFEISYRLA